MSGRKRIVIGLILVVILALGGWHIGARWYWVNKLYRSPEMKHRVAMVPKELDVTVASATHGVTCNVGYATFVVPVADSIELTSSRASAGVFGMSTSLFFGLVPPFDPSTLEATAFKKDLNKLPSQHPLRQQLAGPDATFLDFEIYAERSLPDPLWKVVFQDRSALILNMAPLLHKASATQMGMHGVYTYSCADTRGLIRVGSEEGDRSRAFVSIENNSGTQGVGMMIQLQDGKEGDVMKILPAMLKTFRFTAEELGSVDEVKSLIAQAGILPIPEAQSTE
jgi:hypothetical protein